MNDEPTHAFVNYVKDNVRKIVPVCYVENFCPKHESDFDMKRIYTVMREVYNNIHEMSFDDDESDPEMDDLDLVEAEASILKLGGSFESLRTKISEKRISVTSKRYLFSPSKATTQKVESNEENDTKNRKIIKTRKKTIRKSEQKRQSSKNSCKVSTSKEKISPSEIENVIQTAKENEKRIIMELVEENKDLEEENISLVKQMNELDTLNKSLQHELINKVKETNSFIVKKVSELESLFKNLQEAFQRAFKEPETDIIKKVAELEQLNKCLQVEVIGAVEELRKPDLATFATRKSFQKVNSPNLTKRNLNRKSRVTNDTILDSHADISKETVSLSDETATDDNQRNERTHITASDLPKLLSRKNNQIHIGYGIYVSEANFEKAMKKNVGGSRLIKNLAVVIWGNECLKKSSVTGRPNRTLLKYRNCKGRPALGAMKIRALQDCVATILKDRGTSQRDIDILLSRTKKILLEKICDLRRVSR